MVIIPTSHHGAHRVIDQGQHIYINILPKPNGQINICVKSNGYEISPNFKWHNLIPTFHYKLLRKETIYMKETIYKTIGIYIILYIYTYNAFIFHT